MKLFIFDFDGLILDTEVPIYKAWLRDYEKYGQSLDLQTYSGCVGSDFGGFDPKSHLELLVGKELDWKSLDPARDRYALKIVETLDPMPGVEELLQAAVRSNIPCVIASSSPLSWVVPHIDRLGLSGYFTDIVCIDHVSAAKPSPELFLKAASLSKVAPGDAIVFEDSLNGLRAAQAAKCPCVIAPNRITAHLDFAGALQVVNSIAEVSIEKLRDWIKDQ